MPIPVARRVHRKPRVAPRRGGVVWTSAVAPPSVNFPLLICASVIYNSTCEPADRTSNWSAACTEPPALSRCAPASAVPVVSPLRVPRAARRPAAAANAFVLSRATVTAHPRCSSRSRCLLLRRTRSAPVGLVAYPVARIAAYRRRAGHAAAEAWHARAPAADRQLHFFRTNRNET